MSLICAVGVLTELKVFVSLVGGWYVSEWLDGVGIVSVDAAKGGFPDHCIPVGFTDGSLGCFKS